jgi:hypothetical protein
MGMDSASQDFAFVVCGNFYEEAGEGDPTFGPDDDIEVLKWAQNFLPPWRDLPAKDGYSTLCCLSDVSISQISSSIEHSTWKITATYSVPSNSGESAIGSSRLYGPTDGPGGGENWSEEFTQVSCNISGGTVLRKNSLALVAKARNPDKSDQQVSYPINAPAPVGLSKEGIQGVEVPDVTFTFQITVYVSPSKLTYRYVRKLAKMYGCLNSDIFFGFPPKAVRFSGASFSGHLYQNIPLTFEFEQRNPFKFSQEGPGKSADPEVDDPLEFYDVVYDPQFSSQPPDGVFSGFDHIEYLFVDQIDEDAGVVILVPSHRLVHRVCEYAAFSSFEI